MNNQNLLAPLSFKSLSLIMVVLVSANVWAEFPLLNFNSIAVEENYTTNPDESLVRVSGVVRKRNTVNAPLLSEEMPAEGIRVRFWQPDQPNRFYYAETDAEGRYEIGLNEGLWLGEACGSSEVFLPARWEALIGSEKLLNLKAVSQPEIHLNAALPSYNNTEGESVTLQGDGFGCNGKLVFQYTNHVLVDGETGPVVYDRRPISVAEFSGRSDTNLSFSMPELGEDQADIARHVAKVYYQQGNVRSNSIVLSQFLRDVSLATSTLNPIVTIEGELVVDPPGPDAGASDLGTEVLQEDKLGTDAGIIGGSPLSDVPQTDSQSSDLELDNQPTVQAILRKGISGGRL